MLGKTLWRITVGLCFAIPAGLTLSATVQAQPFLANTDSENCEGCHEIIRSYWAGSAHGQASSDPIFLESWEAQGKPNECLMCHTTGFDPRRGTWKAEGIACQVCHYPAPDDHPEAIMPTDVSSRLCGSCHLDTYAEWQTSTHAQEKMACMRCHDPHTTGLKAGSAQDLCRSCHNEQVHFFSYSTHALEGLLCVDCHLRISETQMGEGHGKRTHTFAVDIQTCQRCHGDEMHYPSPKSEPQTEQAGMLPLRGKTGVEDSPIPANPWGFAVMAALIGMAAGMILAPWLERWFRHFREMIE